MQGRGGLASSIVCPSCNRRGKLTCFGQEPRVIPPNGINAPHLHALPGEHPSTLRLLTTEGSDDGGASKACSGRERCLPQLRDFLMHFWEK